MSRSSIVLLFSFLSLAANAQRDSLRSSELNDQAVLWLILEDYQKALVTLDSAILFDSLNAQAYGNRSAAWDGLGVFDEALLNVNKAISIDSLNAAHYYNRGLLLKNNYQYYRSALDFKKAINLDPKHLPSINKLAYYYFEFKEDYDSCKKVIEDYMWYGTTKTKKDADLIGLYGYLKMKEGDLQGAITEFDLAISIDSTSAEAYFNRGLVYYKLKRYKPSIADYSKAIELGRSAPQTHYNRALSYEYLRDFESAIDDYDQELKMHGATANTFNNRGRCFMILNQFQPAYDDYMRALELEPNRPLTLHNIGLLYLRHDQKEKGCVYLRKALDHGYPDSSIADEYCP